MAYRATKYINEFTWNAPRFDLRGAYPWKWRIFLLAATNSAGRGRITFDPRKQANSLVYLETGMRLTLYALDVVNGNESTYFDIDNGEAPGTGTSTGTSTLAALRGYLPEQANATYYVTDRGQEGYWRQVPGDTTTPDNGATHRRSSNGILTERINENQVLLTPWFEVVPNDKSPEVVRKNTLVLNDIFKKYKEGELTYTAPSVGYAGETVVYVQPLYQATGELMSVFNEACLNIIDTNLRQTMQPGVRIEAVTRCLVTRAMGFYTRPRPSFGRWAQRGADGQGCDFARIGYYFYGNPGDELADVFVDCRPTPDQLASLGHTPTASDIDQLTRQNMVDKKPTAFGLDYRWRYEYDSNYGNYNQYNGFDAFACVFADELQTDGNAGHGLLIFGNTTTYFTTSATIFIVVIQRQVNNDVHIIFPDASLLSLFPGGGASTVKLDLPGDLPGGTGAGFINAEGRLEVNVGGRVAGIPPDGTSVAGRVYGKSLNVFADGGVIQNLSSSNNNGAGAFTTGDEANTNRLPYAELNRNGLAGGADGSLLANDWTPLLKTASNGLNFQCHFAGQPGPRFRSGFTGGGFTNLGNSTGSSNITGMYSESDQARSTPNGRANIGKGIAEMGITGTGIVGDGIMQGLRTDTPAITVYHGGYDGSGGETWLNRNGSRSVTHTALGLGFGKKDDTSGIYLERYGNGGTFNGRTFEGPFQDSGPRMQEGYWDNFIGSFADLAPSKAPNASFINPDKKWLRPVRSNFYKFLVCESPGSNKMLPAGITAHQDTSAIVFSQAPPGKVIGETFEIAGPIKYPNNRVTPQDSQYNTATLFYVGEQVRAQPFALLGEEYPVQYARARWSAHGDGVGLLSERPDMSDGEGNYLVGTWRYRATDVQRDYTWNGDAATWDKGVPYGPPSAAKIDQLTNPENAQYIFKNPADGQEAFADIVLAGDARDYDDVRYIKVTLQTKAADLFIATRNPIDGVVYWVKL